MPRFFEKNDVVIDDRSGLMWTKNAGLLKFPVNWEEALVQIRAFNKTGIYGYHDWKLPNRRELFILPWAGPWGSGISRCLNFFCGRCGNGPG